MNFDFLLKDYISKDIIKARIYELEEDIKNYESCTTVWLQLAAELDILEELLIENKYTMNKHDNNNEIYLFNLETEGDFDNELLS